MSKIEPKDEAGRKHLYDLLHVAWLFKKGMEHYVAQGEQAKFDLIRMEDMKKKGIFGGLL